ncbi:hypothetical protein BD413DRAFT_142840 [Trametes elegans]|nr:hypothetical protein BD413DRAFT_142840 [Trametes elegans]
MSPERVVADPRGAQGSYSLVPWLSPSCPMPRLACCVSPTRVGKPRCTLQLRERFHMPLGCDCYRAAPTSTIRVSQAKNPRRPSLSAFAGPMTSVGGGKSLAGCGPGLWRGFRTECRALRRTEKRTTRPWLASNVVLGLAKHRRSECVAHCASIHPLA